MLYMNGGTINCHTCIRIVFAINISLGLLMTSKNVSAGSSECGNTVSLCTNELVRKKEHTFTAEMSS